MALNIETASVTVNGNDVATSFSFSPMVINDAEHLEVHFIDADGVDQGALLQGTGANKYSVVVSNYPGTGSITYPTSGSDYLATGEKLIILRVVPLTQETNLGTESGYDSEVQEATFDYSRMVDQQQQEQLDRSLKVPLGDGTDPADYLVTIAEEAAETAIADAEAAAAAAAASASDASGSASSASTSASTATTQAGNASTSASSASTSASTATTQAGNASTSATNASNSAAAAAASALAAAASNQAYYDASFNAGYTSAMAGADLAVQTYGDIVVGRAFTATGESGYIRTVATGAKVIVDIEKNGTSIYTTKPEFAISSNTMTAGVLKSDGTQIFAAGDRMTFKVTQIGSTIKGQQLMFTLKGNL